MAHVIVKSGSYGIGDRFFYTGATECTDELILDAIRNEELPWIWVDENYAEPVESSKVSTEEPQPAIPTQGQKLVAETTHDVEVPTAVAKMEEALAPEPEKPTPGYPCPFCEKVLKNPGGQMGHIKTKHEAQFDEWDRERRAAKE